MPGINIPIRFELLTMGNNRVIVGKNIHFSFVMWNVLRELLIQLPFHVTRETFQANYYGGTNLSVYSIGIVTIPYTVTTNITKVMIFLSLS